MCHFNEGGGAQLQYDITRNLVLLLAQHTGLKSSQIMMRCGNIYCKQGRFAGLNFPDSPSEVFMGKFLQCLTFKALKQHHYMKPRVHNRLGL